MWRYLSRFTNLVPFTNRVKAVNARGVFSFPINLHTINQFYGTNFNPSQARAWLLELTKPYGSNDLTFEPRNFEEKALNLVGKDLYEAFLKHYTIKQWGRDPKEIPASILSRMPVRFDYNDSYQMTKLSGIPENGYTQIFERLLTSASIEVRLSQPFYPGMETNYDHVFYTGPIDHYFDYDSGRLSYRTVTFERYDGEGDLQGNAVLNYTDMSRACTRTTEHKHFAPWEQHDRSVLFAEHFKDTEGDDVPFYPIRTARDMELLASYQERAKQLEKVTFLGRLGGYRYTNMAATIREALDVSRRFLQLKRSCGWGY